MKSGPGFIPPRRRIPGRWIEACLLCLLEDEESYGYNLLEKLKEFGFEQGSLNLSVIYRNLRSMEERNLVVSSWVSSEQGPDKRIYAITSQGEKTLVQWIILLKERRKMLEMIINNYDNKRKAKGMGG